MTHLHARVVVSALATVPLLALIGVDNATASSGVAVDGDCPPTYSFVPADSELRQRIDAATGSVDGVICAMELNVQVPFDRNLIDNMAQ
jgi:hypothetical protein